MFSILSEIKRNHFIVKKLFYIFNSIYNVSVYKIHSKKNYFTYFTVYIMS
jgi:hypothetical protein